MLAKRIAVLLLVILLTAGAYAAGIWFELFGKLEQSGDVSMRPRPEEAIVARSTAQDDAARALGISEPKQILFGDLHVHTTFSVDAFLFSLPFMQGEGAHPPADACDFARYCSALDFWSINDHAESLTARKWREIKQSVRQCNAVAGRETNPDLVTFLGWEWTQETTERETSWGHKNVVFLDTADDAVPTRPIAAGGGFLRVNKQGFPMPTRMKFEMPWYDFSNRQRYYDYYTNTAEIGEFPICEQGKDVRDLPADCLEVAETPHELFEKLDQWGFESIVIPHGTAWGANAPPGVLWDKHLANANHDPDRQIMIEVYSGHGNSEEYRSWRAVEFDDQGNALCPKPQNNFTPHCWRAGEIIFDRCAREGLPAAECRDRAEEARRNFVDMGMFGMNTVPGSTAADWLNSGQCTDCFLPDFSLRPGRSVQYALAVSNFDLVESAEDESARPGRMRFSFVGSTDTHRARAGSGYKEFSRRTMTDVIEPRDAEWFERFAPPAQAPVARSIENPPPGQMGSYVNFERSRSFLTTGGLAAVHATGRDRQAIWDAFQRKEVYGTSGPRILLWFHLLNGEAGELPMGSETALRTMPRFRVQAVGAFKQKPGCPDHVLDSLTPTRLQNLCSGECYHPSDERYLITRIEVVRIRPQRYRGEKIDPLIESPWRVLECPENSTDCTIEFEDPEFAEAERDSVYYVRAIQEPSLAINGNPLRCEFDAEGDCSNVKVCAAGYPKDPNENCLDAIEERAWSSPIFVDYRQIID
jgi:hypothetical protein